MRGELTDTHTGGGASSALSKMTGIVQHQTYDNLKKAMQNKIREAYDKLNIPYHPNTSQPNTKSLEKSINQLVESVLQEYNEYEKAIEKVRHGLLAQNEKNLNDYQARTKRQEEIFGEEVLILRLRKDEEIKQLRAAHDEEIQKLQDRLDQQLSQKSPRSSAKR